MSFGSCYLFILTLSVHKGYLIRCVCGIFVSVSFFPRRESMNCHLNICLVKEANWNETVYLCVFYFSFLISLPLPLSIIKGRNAPGKPMREVSETWAHSHGFCLSHPAFCVWPLCKNCVCARACVYYTFCLHLKMGVASPLATHEEPSSNAHCRCHLHDNSRGWGERSL